MVADALVVDVAMVVLVVETEDATMTNAHLEDAVILVLETEVTDAHLKALEVEVIDALVVEDLAAEVIEDPLEETLDDLKALQVLRDLIDQDVLDAEIKYRNLVTLLRGFFLPSC